MMREHLARGQSAWRRAWAAAMLLGCAIVLPVRAPARAGELVDHSFHSNALGRAWRIAVYQPTGYATGTAALPVLYFLPGNAADPQEWRALNLGAIANAAIAAGRMPPGLIVVPELGTSWGIDSRDRMQAALRDDLLAEVERVWRVRPGREGRAIGGISAGAYAALRLALLDPARFSALVLLSPAIYDPEPPPHSGARSAGVFGARGFDPAVWRALNYPTLLPGFASSGARLPLYLAAGDADTLGTQHEAARLHATWQRLGSPVEFRTISGAHSYDTWRRLLPDALAFAFRIMARP